MQIAAAAINHTNASRLSNARSLEDLVGRPMACLIKCHHLKRALPSIRQRHFWIFLGFPSDLDPTLKTLDASPLRTSSAETRLSQGRNLLLYR